MYIKLYMSFHMYQIRYGYAPEDFHLPFSVLSEVHSMFTVVVDCFRCISSYVFRCIKLDMGDGYLHTGESIDC